MNVLSILEESGPDQSSLTPLLKGVREGLNFTTVRFEVRCFTNRSPGLIKK